MPRTAAPRRTPKPAARRTPPRTALPAPHVALVLDETSSMDRIRTATISAYNEYVATLQRDPSARGARFALIRFNTDRTVAEPATDISAVAPLTLDTYRPAAMTDLYDAIGRTIHRIDSEAPKGPVICVILTDGEENSSKEYRPEQVRALISDRQATGRWTFVYLGANQDAWQAGAALGIPVGNSMTWQPDAHGTKVVMAAAANGTTSGLRAYATAGVTASQSFLSDAGIDKCLACGTTLVLGQVHACVGKNNSGPWLVR